MNPYLFALFMFLFLIEDIALVCVIVYFVNDIVENVLIMRRWRHSDFDDEWH